MSIPVKKKQQVTDMLLLDIKTLIEEGRRQLAVTVNSTLTMLYWQVGKRINGNILGNASAAYGDEIVSTLSRQLTAKYGNGFAAIEKSLLRLENREVGE